MGTAVGRWISWLCAVWLSVLPLSAQEFSGLARLDVAQSVVTDVDGGIAVTLYMSQPVPWRVFTLDNPKRLVLDFREVDWRGATPDALLQALGANDLRFGSLRPGWSRMVVDLARPMIVDEAGMTVGDQDGTATVHVTLKDVSGAEFAAAAGAPPDPGWDEVVALDPTVPAPPPDDGGPLVVVIDPGHGGIDPGAEREGMVEADVVLHLGKELADAVTRSGGMRAVLTRDSDVFVPLAARMTIARAAGADVFISLHADALEEANASGASVYTLTQEAFDTASERMAERHNRGDLLAGVDLSGQDDTVATVLMDLARLETGPQSLRLADTLVAQMVAAGVQINNHPRREAPLAVLNAADFPSVLVEVGFLSDADDRERLSSDEGRAVIVTGIVDALQLWAADEEARGPLLRQ
ncbi:MAG: N-acetylmuramoyl-L-alanine amidase [Rhodobacterales bacterium]|nr:N-acetylmuramoyl-L-alanine amidase [Rhodobacterales bacterium]